MPERGEVWLVDFGITQKVRPALVISVPYAETDRALLGVIPHTTATRGSLFEVPISSSVSLRGSVPRAGHTGDSTEIFRP